MKKLRTMFCAAAVLVMSLMLSLNALADESLTVGMDAYRTDEGKIEVYVNHNKGDSFDVDLEESFVVVGKQSLALESAEKFGDMGEPVTYMFVVDVSGSMDTKRIDIAKEIINQFVENKNDDDNFYISAMGNELVSSGFLDNEEELASFIDSIEVTHEDTNLYASIQEELNVLQTGKNVNDKRCLIIISDGADEQTVGTTREEAETAVKDAHIPVFTVALLPDKYKDSDLESAKILGSFARYSAGGVHYAPQIDDIEYTDIYDGITGVIDNSLVLTADLADAVADDGNIYLGVVISDGTESGKDGVQIPAGDILDAISIAQNVTVNLNIDRGSSAETEVETETETETVIEKEEESGYLLWIIIAVIVIIAIIAVLLILLVNKGKGKKAEEQTSGQSFGGTPSYNAAPSLKAAPPVSAVTKEKEFEVELVKIGPGEEERYSLKLSQGAKRSIGRSKSCDLCFSNDGALSGTHCYIYRRDGRVYVQDNKSTNRTYVNGVPISEEYSVENGDVLLIGSAEYRIVFA